MTMVSFLTKVAAHYIPEKWEGIWPQDSYRAAIEKAGLRIELIEENPRYQFISDNARGASKKFVVKSVPLLAVKA